MRLHGMRRGEEEKTGGGLEPEGETETGNPSLMERGGGRPGYRDGEGCHERVQAKRSARRRR